MTISPLSIILCAGAIAFGGMVAGIMLGVAAAIEVSLAVGRLERE